MKIKQLLAGVFALGLITSCNDNLPDEGGKVLENETKTYVKISLVNTDGGTRAQDGEFADDLFEDGEEAENEVKKVLLVFYDASRKYVGNTELTNLKDEGGNDDLTIARILTTVAEVNLPENTNHPKYVMAYVNPTSASSDLVNKEKLEDLIKVIRANNTVSPDGMTMNNSVYYDEAIGMTRFAAEVDFTTQFFKTEEAAKAAKAVDITVERVQAKVRVEKFDDIKVNPVSSSETAAEYTLTFVPEDWFVNGRENRTFLIKNYRSTPENYLSGNATTDDMGMTFADLQSRFNAPDNRKNQFNEQRRKRSYWALDPTYFFTSNTLYPTISYDVKNGSVNNDGKEYSLNYRSYNQGIEANSKKVGYEYCLENTQNVATLMSDRAKASMTSVVLLGHYVIQDKEGTVVFDGSSDKGTFYIHHDDSKTKTILLTKNDVINYFLERTGSLLYYPVDVLEDGTGNKVGVDYQPLRAAHVKKDNLYDDFDLAHPVKISSDLLGQSVVSEQWRTLKFKDALTDAQLGKYYVYEQKEDGNYDYVPLTRAKLNSMLKNLYSAFGLVESFKEGKAYFNVPLKHIFYNASLYDHKNANSNEFDAEKVQLGDYGVVRNHVYSLKIGTISGLGSGIGDLNQPIVPPTEVDKYYISARLNILKWRIVSQSVDL